MTRQRDASTDSLTLFAADHPGLSFRSLLDGFNEQWVTASHFLSTELVIEMLGLVGDWSEAFYCDVGLDTTAREPVGLFARLEKPIDFEAVDERPADLIFVLLTPEGAGADHLKALARVSRLFRDRAMCEKLRGTDNVDALTALLTDRHASHAA